MWLTIQSDRHLVKDTPVARTFRRRLKCDDIITFWNGETGQWVLAYWVDKSRRLVDEIEDLGMAFEALTPELVQQIIKCWKPIDWKEKKRRILSKERDRLNRERDELEEDQRRWDWAQKQLADRGKAPIPFAFNSPISGGQVG